MNKRSAETTKCNILDAARQVFTENGYAEASMRLIAQTARISVGCLYLHFKNKEDLYHTLMQQWMKDLEEQTITALAQVDDPTEAIKAFIAVTIRFARNHREMIMLQGREFGFSFGLELKQQFFRERRVLLNRIIEEGVGRGCFTGCDTEEAAKVIFSALRGFVFSMVIDEHALFSEQNCSNLILNGLLRRNSG